MRLPSHETGFDLGDTLHPAPYRDKAVRAEREGLYGSIPAFVEYSIWLCSFRRQTPEPNRAVGSTADQPTTVGAEGKPMNRSLVSVEHSAGRVDGAEIPESNCAVFAAGGQPMLVGRTLFLTIEHQLSNYTEAWALFFGLIFIGFVIFAPEGIWGLMRARFRRRGSPAELEYSRGVARAR
jgi:hypothetical protein